MSNPPQWLSAEQVQAMIDEQITQLREQHSEEVSTLRAELTAAQQAASAAVVTTVPADAGGIGTAIHDTWSQYEQEQQYAKHEAELAAARG